MQIKFSGVFSSLRLIYVHHLLVSNFYVIIKREREQEKTKWFIDKINGMLMLNWHFKLFLTTLYLSVSFAASFDFVLDHQFCIMQRDLCMLVVIVVVVVALRCIANSFSIHFHLISRIDVIVCMLLCHCHHTSYTHSHWQFHFHTRARTHVHTTYSLTHC